MKKNRFLFFILISANSLSLLGQNSNNKEYSATTKQIPNVTTGFTLDEKQTSTDKKNMIATMERILNCTDGFELEKEYAQADKNGLSLFIRNLYEMQLATFFRQDEKAMNQIDSLIINHWNDLGAWQACRLVGKKANLFFKHRQYAQAADYIHQHFYLAVSKDDSLYFSGREDYYNEFRNVPCNMISRPKKTVSIDYTPLITPSKRGYNFIVQILVNGKKYPFIFDTCGGDGSVVSEEMAKKMGLKNINKGTTYGGSGEIKTINATIDSIMLGEIVYRNPLIEIVQTQDSLFINYGILGNDIMHMLGACTIYPDKHKIVFPYKMKPSNKQHNMMYGGGLYFLQAHSGKEKILFSLDSGATNSLVLAPYYLKHKEWFDQNGIKDTITVGEIGKKHLQDFVNLKSMPVTVGKTNVSLKNVFVFPNMHFDAFGDQLGVFGTNFFECFHKVTVNFRDMYVDVKK